MPYIPAQRAGLYGIRVSQYLNTYVLLNEEPVVESTLALLLKHFFIGAKSESVYLVPISPMSAYLVAKRLIQIIETTPEKFNIVHPSDVERNLNKRMRAYLFVDAAFMGSRVTREIERLSRYTQIAEVILCFNLKPSPSSPRWKTPTQEMVRLPLSGPIDPKILASNSTIYEVDPITNDLISEEMRALSSRFKQLTWMSPISRGSAIPEKSQFSPVDFENMFIYGLQMFAHRIQIARCPISSLLSSSKHNGFLVNWLAQTVLNASTAFSSETDIVLFVRDDSVLWSNRDEIGKGLASALRKMEPTWRGNVFAEQIITTHHVTKSIQRYSRRQFFVSNCNGESNIFTNANPPTVNNKCIGLLLDNAAISGRAIRDFALEISKRIEIGSVIACPIIDKMSPSEATFFSAVPSLNVIAPNCKRCVSFGFSALLQVRIRSFPDPESVPVLVRLRRLAESSARTSNTDISNWAKATQLALEVIRNKEDSNPIQVPLLLTHRNHTKVSIRAITLRHLIAVYQQGIPVLDEIESTFRDAIANNDTSILVILALEPDLAIQKPLVSFSAEIEQFALQSLISQNSSSGVRANAIWILASGLNFARYARQIAKVCFDNSLLRPPWLAILLGGLEGSVREQAIGLTIRELDGLSTEQARTVRTFVRALQTLHSIRKPEDDETARQLIRDLLVSGRTVHGRLFGGWCAIRSALRESQHSSNVRPSDLNLQLWTEAEEFLRERLLPALRAAGVLCQKYWRELQVAEEQAAQSFQRARECAQISDPSQNDVLNSWLDLMRSTITGSVEHIYMQYRECVLLQNPEPNRLEDVGLMDMLLPRIVQEPIGLLLHALAGYLGDNTPASLMISDDDGTVYNESMPLKEHLIRCLEKFWANAATIKLGVCWMADTLVNTFKAVADEVRKHAPSNPELSIVIQVKESFLRMKISNRKRNPDPGGTGTGRKQIQSQFSKLGAGFSTSPPGSDPHWYEWDLPIDWLDLPPIGND